MTNPENFLHHTLYSALRVIGMLLILVGALLPLIGLFVSAVYIYANYNIVAAGVLAIVFGIIAFGGGCVLTQFSEMRQKNLTPLEDNDETEITRERIEPTFPPRNRKE